jgi:M6 family metalloprotease-like protein
VKPLVYISVIVSIFFAILVPALTGAAQTVLPRDVTLEGSLSLIWVDNPARMELSLPPLVYLTLENGLKTLVIPDPQSGLSLEDLLVLEGERVQVQGEWAVLPGSAASDVFLASSILLLDDELRPAAVSDFVLGNQRWLSILCMFPNIPEVSHDLSFFQDMYSSSYPGLDHYWRELSYDKINLAGSMAYGWFTMPKPSSDYSTVNPYPDLAALAQDCAAAADPAVYFPDFDGVNYMFNAVSPGWMYGGREPVFVDGSYISLPTTWLSPGGYQHLGLVAHEMGHAFGLPHSTAGHGGVSTNPWDVMSIFYGAHIDEDSIYGRHGPHTIAYHKQLLGWIPPEQVYTARSGTLATIHLERLALPQTNDYLIAVIPKAGSLRQFYTIEARYDVGYDQQLAGTAVIIHDVDIDNGSVPAFLMDINSNGFAGYDGAMWTEGETFIDESLGISVSIDERTASGFLVTINSPSLFSYDCSGQTEISQKECRALVKLHESTGGDHWNVTWDPSVPSPCMWYAVYCQAGKVIELWLSWLGLTGSIPDEIGDLEFLEFLNLSGNDLSGGIPSTITQLSRLAHLHMNTNRLSGSIPADLAKLTRLETIGLFDNELTGSIPLGLGDLELAYLDLSGNQLTGSIPPEIGRIAPLYRLSLQDNKLSGSIPVELGLLERLSELNLGDNMLTGSLPAQLGELKNLYHLSVENNRLSGQIPPEIGNASSLFQLLLSNNDLEGGIPPELWKLRNLYHLGLDRNRLTGNIPPQLSRMFRLEILDLSYNRLTGELSTEFNYTPSWFTPHLRNNALQVSDPVLRALLDERTPGWEHTQTVPPGDLVASAPSWDRVVVSWSPVLYTADGGYFEIGCAIESGGPYQSCGKTAGKNDTGITLLGLAPGRTHYLAARTFTPAHGEQKNDLWSEYSPEVSVTVPVLLENDPIQPLTVFFLPLIHP